MKSTGIKVMAFEALAEDVPLVCLNCVLIFYEKYDDAMILVSLRSLAS